MKPRVIEQSRGIHGAVSLPGDKSISHRALMIGSLSQGTTRSTNLADCDDCDRTMRAFKSMGIGIEKDPKRDVVIIEGKGLKGLTRPRDGTIHAGESGTTMRLLAGILAGQNFSVTLEGGASLSRRPMARIVEPLRMMGAAITAQDGNFPPLQIQGGALLPIEYHMKVPSAQVKSAVLFAGLYSNATTTVHEPVKSRDHTERMLSFFGADIIVKDLAVALKGGSALTAREIEIPADMSSAAFFLVAATMIPGSRVTLRSVCLNPTRSGIIDILVRMGARITIRNQRETFEPVADITAESSETRGIVIEQSEFPRFIDEAPLVFVLASVSKGKTIIKGAGELRVKETDRIASMVSNLKKMGAHIDAAGDDVSIEGVRSLRPAKFESRNDHRTAMSMAIAALSAPGKSELDDETCVSKSFPRFFEVVESLNR